MKTTEEIVAEIENRIKETKVALTNKRIAHGYSMQCLDDAFLETIETLEDLLLWIQK